NMGQMMKQAQQLQSKIFKIQEEMGEKTAEGSAGGGMVTVTANGKQEIVSVKIDPEVVTPDDVEMLEDLVTAAANDALKRAQQMVSEAIGKITGGMNIPGLM
ncbi:MAG: YbaB/EbfC family nucleoid-associated protein, partial [Deltaproteobacteria bacterium]|nr:YbaB/EbfC family nucleoid-associated protein [Deltaproteobacteria bacterium]